MIDEEKLINCIGDSKSKYETLLKYFGYANKRVYVILNKFIQNKNINILHFERQINEIFCINCHKIITSKNKKFCDRSCSATYNNKKRKLSKNTKNKISKSLKKFNLNIKKTIKKICVICNKEFIVKKTKSGRLSKCKTCSKKCNKILRSVNGKKNMETLIKNGRHKGWIKRNKLSYPEKFFIDILNNNNIKYITNYSISKKDLGLNEPYSYFLDFYIEDKNIDLEIDGAQHNKRKEHDKFRDKYLSDAGYNIYRIQWKSINTENGKKYIKNEIDKFLEFYNNM